MSNLISTLLGLLAVLILVDAALTWIVPPRHQVRRLTSRLTAPLYAPIRAVLPPRATGGVDLSPLVLLLAIYVLRRLLGGG